MMMSALEQAGEDERLAALEPEEDALDAFNDETFGGDGMGETWQEAQHEELAKMTEQERAALQQSQDFFNFGSDGEELGGELEEPLETPPSQNGGGLGAGLAGLSLQPAPPLSVQTQPAPAPAVMPSTVGGFPGHHPAPPHLLPPSHYAAPAPAPYQDPAIMSLSKMPPPGPLPVLYPGQPGVGATRSSAYSPATVPGLKTLADLEAEMFRPVPAVPPVNPTLHNLNYPGMRDRQGAPRHSAPQQQRHQQHQQQHQQHHHQQQQQRHELPNVQIMPQHPRPDMMQRQDVHSMQQHQQRQEIVHIQQHQQQMRGSHQQYQQQQHPQQQQRPDPQQHHQQQQRPDPQHHHQGHHQQQQHHGHHQQQSHHMQYQQQAQYRQSPIQQGGRPGPARQENWQYEQERREGQWAGQEREQWGRQEGGGRDWGAHRQERRDYGRQYDNRYMAVACIL